LELKSKRKKGQLKKLTKGGVGLCVPKQRRMQSARQRVVTKGAKHDNGQGFKGGRQIYRGRVSPKVPRKPKKKADAKGANSVKQKQKKGRSAERKIMGKKGDLIKAQKRTAGGKSWVEKFVVTCDKKISLKKRTQREGGGGGRGKIKKNILSKQQT